MCVKVISDSPGWEELGILLLVCSWGLHTWSVGARLTWPEEDAFLKTFWHDCAKHVSGFLNKVIIKKGLIETFCLGCVLQGSNFHFSEIWPL